MYELYFFFNLEELGTVKIYCNSNNALLKHFVNQKAEQTCNLVCPIDKRQTQTMQSASWLILLFKKINNAQAVQKNKPNLHNDLSHIQKKKKPGLHMLGLQPVF